MYFYLFHSLSLKINFVKKAASNRHIFSSLSDFCSAALNKQNARFELSISGFVQLETKLFEK